MYSRAAQACDHHGVRQTVAVPLWRDPETIDVTSRWRDDWQSATVVGQFQLNGRPHNPTLRFRPSPASVVTAESF